MKKHLILIYLMILVVFSRLPRESTCLKLRKFSVSFNDLRKESEQNEMESNMREFRNRLQSKMESQEDETMRQIIRKYLLPLAGRTSFMNDFSNRF